MVEAESLAPDADHPPAVEEEDADHDGVEHGFGGEGEALLDGPEEVDACELSGDADDEEVG